MPRPRRRSSLAATGLTVLLAVATPALTADFVALTGHGGPIKGVDISNDGTRALTASFDYAIGLWDLADPAEPRWLDGHRAAVNTVLFLPDGRVVSGSDDFDLRIWDLESGESRALSGHRGKVMALAYSADAGLIASAAWDGWIGLWSASDGSLVHLLKGHQSNVNDVAFAEDGRVLYSASSDGTIRTWDVADGQQQRRVLSHGFGINQIVLNEAAGWLAYGALDGGTRAVALSDGRQLADLTLDRRPILAMTANPAGTELAVGDGEGHIMVVDTRSWTITRDFRAAKRGPVWALDYGADGQNVLAGGLDDAAFYWPVAAGAVAPLSEGERTFLNDPDTMENGARQFYRKCSICHTLTPDGARRAGPTLHNVIGRPAGTVPGYAYSDALTGLDLVWTEETIARLFEIGPDDYTPGSKMPMQRIAREADRDDLVAFLKSHAETAEGSE
ncbi:MAG: c-type cytochrome [Pseudomonadota bacterium]